MTDAHPSDQIRCHSLRIDHRLIGSHREMQVPVVHTPEATQGGTECRACSLAGVAGDLTLAITLLIPGPFMSTVADGGVGWMATAVALPCIRVERHAVRRDVLGAQVRAGAWGCVVADPPALLACV